MDECSSDCINNCDKSNSFCVNLVGSYECECKQGFTRSIQHQCIDIDECENRYTKYVHSAINDCHEDAKCINTYGSYKCVCQTGFYGNGSFCEGITEF